MIPEEVRRKTLLKEKTFVTMGENTHVSRGKLEQENLSIEKTCIQGNL
jgi:hypothetical protein